MKTGVYRHYKGHLYVVLGVVRDSTNGPNEGQEMVMYWSIEKQLLHVRERSQFEALVDGEPRFAPVVAEVSFCATCNGERAIHEPGTAVGMVPCPDCAKGTT